MANIQYAGEHLLPGVIGNAAIMTSFVAGMVASIAYFFATQQRDTPQAGRWIQIGRYSFALHGLSVFTIIGLLFFMMINQYYEYQYVQAHVSEDLPMRYIFSAFWEGQEGSFLLWMFWHVVLGGILMIAAKKWEAPTLSVLAMVQVFISSMILGVYITEDIKVGSNPFLLLRDVMDIPLFNNKEYVNLIRGNGLNPLLQNYWMTIHPPTLFLGFASTVIPFCYAIAGLWTKEHTSWLKPALRWALFSGGILGTGILMGGAWAYEALSFGGYWAWDPVENASLVPWLLLIAGLHSNLIAKATGRAIRGTYLFYILSFVFILYSTFLTRSGILGETSVHAFTEMGLEAQLIAFVVVFTLLGVVLLIARNGSIPSPAKEESVASKEFWMFIGTLVLLFSALLITGSTSLPIYNKVVQLFDPTFEGIVINEPIIHYNKYQIWIAIFIGLLSGFTQFLRYREINFKKYMSKFITRAGIALCLTILSTVLLSSWINIQNWQYSVLLAAGVFTVFCNLDYLLFFARQNTKATGSAIAHLGFGVMIIGILASGLNKTFLSSNPFAMRGLLDEEMLQKNIKLLKGDKMFMNGYEVTYLGDTLEGFTKTYEINFKEKNEEGEILNDFTVFPNILYSKDFSKIAASNPSTKHFLSKDIFTHVANLPRVEIEPEFAKEMEAALNYKEYQVAIGKNFQVLDTIQITDLDTAVIRNYPAKLISIDRKPSHPEYHPEKGDITVGATIAIQAEDTVYYAKPMLALRGQMLYGYPDHLKNITTKVKLEEGVFDQAFVSEEVLDYKTLTFKQGESVAFGKYNITFKGFNRNPVHPDYQAEEGDIAIGGIVQVSDNSQVYSAEPVYLIRGNRPFNLKDEVFELGLHIRFNKIDPKSETFELLVAQQSTAQPTFPVSVATNASRTDFIVFEAIEFQGINLFWIGSVAMLIGLFISMVVRMREKVLVNFSV